MNKALLLLLVILVQSQSDGILLPNPNNSDKFDDNLESFQLEDWDSSESPFSSDLTKDYNPKSQPYRKRSPNDVLTRRSALDKNFMRFGRNSGDKASHKYFRVDLSGLPGSKPNFFRFGRGLKDNFIRFGRGTHDNFIRFGRGGGGGGGRDNFIRFGRGVREDFFRFGKSDRENFIRFGKADKNFMRFGRGNMETENKSENLDNQGFYSHAPGETRSIEEELENFERIGKSVRGPDNFIRFGKSGNQKERRNGTNFLRFGKKDSLETNEVPDSDGSNQEATSEETYKYEPVLRIKRRTENSREEENGDENSSNVEKFRSNSGNGFARAEKTVKDGEKDGGGGGDDVKIKRRSTGFFEKIPENFPRRISPVFVSSSWQDLDNLRNSRLTPPFFPISSRYSVVTPFFPSSISRFESKRNQGGSNFIRFG